MKIARFEKRLISYLIDLIITTAMGVALVIIGQVFWSWKLEIVSFVMIAELFEWVFFTIFCGLFLLITNGKTFGMLFTKTRVVKIDNSRLTWKECLIRSIMLGIIPMAIINAIYMVSVHTEKTVFDKISETNVISTIIE